MWKPENIFHNNIFMLIYLPEAKVKKVNSFDLIAHCGTTLNNEAVSLRYIPIMLLSLFQ
jgi:hypothetical protein